MKHILISAITFLVITFFSYLFFSNVELLDIYKNGRSVTKISGLEDKLKNKVNSSTQQSENNYASPISIEYLRGLNIDAEVLQIEQQLPNGSNYSRYIASYYSDGYKIYGLLTVPLGEIPEGGFSAIVFNHGYIPPATYVTTQKYEAYVDYLARNGFVVFKVDLRGHGNSEGIPSGTYFSSSYTKDVISAMRSLQKFDSINPERIGIWGHSMGGNLVLRSMLVEDGFKAGVIWAGAVYSYEDFSKYGISDSSYAGRPRKIEQDTNRENSEEIASLRSDEEIDFNTPFWKSISLTRNINYLNSPLQLHHAQNDSVVSIEYMRDLEKVLKANDITYEVYEYPGGGHNIVSPYFDQAMQRTVDFFKKYL